MAFTSFLFQHTGLTLEQIRLLHTQDEGEKIFKKLFDEWLRIEKPNNLLVIQMKNILNGWGYEI